MKNKTKLMNIKAELLMAIVRLRTSKKFLRTNNLVPPSAIAIVELDSAISDIEDAIHHLDLILEAM